MCLLDSMCSYEIGRHCMLSVAILCTTGQQCLVTKPTIVSSSSSDDVCAVVTQETLRYTCNNDNVVLVWSSSVFSGTISVVATGTTGPLPMPATGVTLTENDNDNTMCLNSTLTFTGTVSDLEQLNGVVLTCDDGAGLTDNVTIVIPGESIIRLQTIRCVIDSILLTALE